MRDFGVLGLSNAEVWYSMRLGLVVGCCNESRCQDRENFRLVGLSFLQCSPQAYFSRRNEISAMTRSPAGSRRQYFGEHEHSLQRGNGRLDPISL